MPNRNLVEVRELVDAGQPPRVSVRHLLAWFNAQRRGYWIVWHIRKDLQELDLETVPDFEYTYIDGPITFRRKPAEPLVEVEPDEPAPIEEVTIVDAHGELLGGAAEDATYRIGKLAPANNVPTSVSPNDQLATALTIMLRRDWSQMPVMTSPRDVKGVITYMAICRHLVLKGPATEVREVMHEAEDVSSELSLFEALPLIAKHGYVLVRGADNTVAGIVTTSDLAVQFRELSEPFLLLGEIENHLRQMLDGKFSKDEIIAARDPADADREIGSIADLAFGEYIRVFEEPGCWEKCCLKVDKRVFVDDLHRVRNLRNDVMHFDPDPLADADLAFLRETARFLRELKALGLF